MFKKGIKRSKGFSFAKQSGIESAKEKEKLRSDFN
jgi:hypothetical protein